MPAHRDSKATLSEVARHAGVSVTTASQVYTGKRPVSAATRQKVLQAAETVGFQPHQGEPTIGIFVRPPEALSGLAFGTATFSNLAGAVAVAGMHRGFAVFTSQGAEGATTHVPRLDGGIVLFPCYHDETLHALIRRGIPTVSFDPDPATANFTWWNGSDYRRSIGELLSHLFDQRAQRVAVMVGQTDNAYRRAILWMYSRAMTTRGTAPTIRIANNNEGQLSATEVATRLLRGNDPPDALITSSSVFAQGAVEAAARLGIEVPSQFMVATATDGPVAETSRPSITGLRLNVNATAHDLVELLARRLKDARQPQGAQVRPLDLMVRESTSRTAASPAAQPPVTAAGS